MDKWAKGREKLLEKYGEYATGLNEWRKIPGNLEKSNEIGRQALSKVHKSRIGQTYEEMYGKERADILRIKCPINAHKKMKELAKIGEHPFQRMCNKMSKEERRQFGRISRSKISYEDFLNKLEENLKEQIESKTFKFTKPEKIMIEILNKLGLNWSTQKRLDSGFFDFYLTDYDVFIEVDGDFIHANPLLYPRNKLISMQKKQIIRDEKKNQIIQFHKKTLLRFWETDLKENIDAVVSKIKLLLNNHQENYKGYYREIKSVKRIPLSLVVFKRVLSLMVEDDESYVTNTGLIAHNCLSNCLCHLDYMDETGTIKYENKQVVIERDYNSFLLSLGKIPQNKDIPSPEQFLKLQNFVELYYHDRILSVIDPSYFSKSQIQLKELVKYIRQSNLYFPINLDISQVLREVKLFSKHKNFQLVVDSLLLKRGDFIYIFSGKHGIYARVQSSVGNQVVIRTVEKLEIGINFGRDVVFKHVE